MSNTRSGIIYGGGKGGTFPGVCPCTAIYCIPGHAELHAIAGMGVGFVFVVLLTFVRFALKCLCKKRLKTRHHEGSAVHERNMLAKVCLS